MIPVYPPPSLLWGRWSGGGITMTAMFPSLSKPVFMLLRALRSTKVHSLITCKPANAVAAWMILS